MRNDQIIITKTYGAIRKLIMELFYLLFHDIQIVNEFVHNLTLTRIQRLLSATNSEARIWYMAQTSKEIWSTTTLDRNICFQYYERRLADQRERPKVEVADGNSLTEQMRVDDERTRVLRQIEALERRMQSTAQPRRKRELYSQIKRLKGVLNG